MKPKICFVVQRYGLEVNGGAELHCRQLAEHMVPYAQVEVLTSKAIKYTTWEDEYVNDIDEIHGIIVRRFPVIHPRNCEVFDPMATQLDYGVVLTSRQEKEWVEEQGPMVPGLIGYLKEHEADYDAFIFFTYLYYPTAMGVPVVGKKAIVIPTAHDEPYLRLRIFENVFRKASAFLFNTEEERCLINKKFKNHLTRSEIGGVGVDVPEHVDARRFKEKYKLDEYIIYVGRIDIGKNCNQLFADFEAYKKEYPSDLKLVLMGKEVIPIPKRTDIISLGFVDDTDKFNGIAGAKALILPSRFESLSMVVLEAFTQNIPVLVNGHCQVLKAHCLKSNGGFYYYNTEEFIQMLQYLLEHEAIATQMGINGHRYVDENYQWDIIVQKLLSLVHYIIDTNRNDDNLRNGEIL